MLEVQGCVLDVVDRCGPDEFQIISFPASSWVKQSHLDHIQQGRAATRLQIHCEVRGWTAVGGVEKVSFERRVSMPLHLIY